MLLFHRKKRTKLEKVKAHQGKKNTISKKHRDYLLEDESIRGEAHSRCEAEDIYDEDDFGPYA